MLKLSVAAALSLLVVVVLLIWMTSAIESQPPLDLVRQTEPPSTMLEIAEQASDHQPSSCPELMKAYRQELESYRACKEHRDCFHVLSGWLPMLAINQQGQRRAELRVIELENVCGPRQSHDAFYSDYGIEVLCRQNLCAVSEITSDEFGRRLQEDTMRTIESAKKETPE